MCYVLCDNEAAVKNASYVESVLNKKHSSVAYNYVRWATVAGIIRVAWVWWEDNLADSLTKHLPLVKRDRLFGDWTYWKKQAESIRWNLAWGDQVNIHVQVLFRILYDLYIGVVSS